jgi:RHS repeat-associated protein
MNREKILQEVLEKRDRCIKHFQMEKKGMAAAVYPMPVHFEEDGVWKEIDNRLNYQEKDGKGTYQNQASALKVQFAKSPQEEDLVTIEKDGCRISWGFGAGQEESSRKKAAGTKNTAAAITRQPKDFRVLGQEEESDHPEEMTAESIPESTTAFTGVNEETAAEPSAVTTESSEASASEGETQEEEIRRLMEVLHLNGEGIYEDILADVDLHYQIQGERIKEDIRLKSREAAQIPLTFTICHEGLSLKENADGSLGLYQELPGEGEPDPDTCVYELVKPFMYDAAGSKSEDVHFETVRLENRTQVTVVPDQTWLQSEERVYPVVIDPMTETSKDTKNIEDTFICQKNQSAVYGNGSFVVGQSNEYGQSRALLKFKNLPKLGNGCIVYAAKMYIWQYGYSTYGISKIPILAHEVTGSWNQKSVNWSNQPAHVSEALDYKEVKEVLSGNQITITPVAFDITKLMRKWYDGGVDANKGILIRSQEEATTTLANRAYARFIASDYPSSGGYQITASQYPCGVIYYRNVSGLEDYQSYHEQPAGRAGCGYTNDYTGNIVWIHPDAKTSGSILPASISHVYNLSEAGTEGFSGYGWRLSAMQELKETGISDYPYVYIDEDGTKHYFYKDKEDGDKLKDEDGLGLTIVQTSGSGYDTYRIMETKDKMRYTFGQDNYLRGIKDPDGNTQTYHYSPASGPGKSNQLRQIKDGTGAYLHLNYNAAGDRLTEIVDEAGRKTTFDYDSVGDLQKVTYPDGKVSKFYQNGEAHQLLAIRNVDNYKVEYTLTNDFQVPRVSKILERGDDSGLNGAPGAVGQVLKISYQNGNTTVFEEAGLDGDIEATADNRKMTYHFDHMGRPSDVIDDDGFANSYQYYSEGMKNHKLGKSGSTQKTVYSLLRNPCLDPGHAQGDGWSSYPRPVSGGAYGVYREEKGNKELGITAVRIESRQTEEKCGIQQNVELEKGVYTFSAYVKTGELSGEATGGNGVSLQILKTDQSVLAKSQVLTAKTDEAINGGWERLCVTFQLSESQRITALGAVEGMTGNAYFSGLQLESGNVANKLNLINNPGFRKIENGAPLAWRYSETEADEKYEITSDHQACAKLLGGIGKNQNISQRVNISRQEGDVYSISGWAKGAGIPDKPFKLAAAVLYEDGSVKWHEFPFNQNIEQWQFVSGVFSTADDDTEIVKNYKSIDIYLFFDDQVNKVLFDGIQLTRDDGESYVYDDDGNLVSAKSAAEKGHFSSDKNSNITKMSEIDGTSFEYAYNDKQHIDAAKSSEGIRYQFGYDGTGSPNALNVQGGKRNCAVSAGKTYYIREKMSGNYLTVKDGGTGNETPVVLQEFSGSTSQKWKLVQNNNGQYQLVPQHAQNMCLDLKAASDTDQAVIQVAVKNQTDAQSWQIHPMENNAYHISCKATKNKKGMTNVGSNTANGHPVLNYTLHDEYANQKWYFEPAEAPGETNSDVPADGKIFSFRVRHSGQYLDITDGGKTEGTKARSYYHSGRRPQQFYLEGAGDGYYYFHPLCVAEIVPELVLARGPLNSAGHTTLCLARKDPSSDAQKFKFAPVVSGQTYLIVCKDGERSLDVMNSSYTAGTDIILTGQPEQVTPGRNKQWIVEACGDRIESLMTYTGKRKQVATVTDSRGYTTANTYDADDRLLTQVKDANDSVTNYTYESNTDQLASVSKNVGGKEVRVTYTYDKDRLKTIGHNGFTYGYTYDVYGNQTSVSAGGTTLERTEYRNNNGLVNKVIYGDGSEIRNAYDKYGQVTAQYLKDSSAAETKLYENVYDNYGNVLSHKDEQNGITYRYQYDLIDRIIGVDTTDGLTLRTEYDKKNRVSSMIQKAGDLTSSTGYLYGDAEKNQMPGLFYGLTLDGTQRVEYTYDGLGRVEKRTVKLDGGKEYHTTYTYVAGNGRGKTTTLVESVTNGTQTLYYTYDGLGNITHIYEKNSDAAVKTEKVRYTYDELSQLVREDNRWLDKTIVYTYDAGGNLTSKEEYAYTTGSVGTAENRKSYTYRTTGWKDQMTAYDGQSITYDTMGNPLSYRGMQMTWQKGRELKGVEKDGTSVTYAYNQEGVRIRKTVGDTETRYYLNGSKIVALETGSEKLHFIYDQSGNLFAMKVGTEMYYYLHNCQNDIIGLVDSMGTQVVSYQYDSWGKPVGMTDATADGVGSKNPFRYKEYCWDEETGFYYVASRYYDPETCRFISADDISLVSASPMELTDKNLYAYCDNNPVMRVDEDGEFWNIAAGAVIGGLIGAGTELITQAVTSKGKIDWKGVVLAGVGGAAGGALAATGAVRGLQAVGNAVISGFSEAYSQVRSGNKNVKSILKNAAVSAVIGGVSGWMGGDGIRAKGSSYRKASESLKSLKGNIHKAVKNPRRYKHDLNHAIKWHGIITRRAVKKTTKVFSYCTVASTIGGRLKKVFIK